MIPAKILLADHEHELIKSRLIAENICESK